MVLISTFKVENNRHFCALQRISGQVGQTGLHVTAHLASAVETPLEGEAISILTLRIAEPISSPVLQK